MRLDRMLANMGVGSRKDVRQLIRNGHVTVNGKTKTRHGQKIDPYEDIVTVFGEQVKYQKYVYLMLNKPQGVISATQDGRHTTVVDLLPFEYVHFEPFPVGRLDVDSVGLLLLTNDGKLAHELTSPKKNVEKVYYVEVEGKVTEDDRRQFADGVTLDDGYETKPAKLQILHSGSISKVYVTITEGKFHQVKRMFQSVGKEVIFLQRIKMGPLMLDEALEEGEIRELTEKELEACLSLKSNE
ncbi:MAG TPA: pseudouridine synthase [Bacillota bacterium]|nr:pseudouridine synthase [Bacillota bacterium]